MHKADRHAVLRDDERADLAGFDNLQRFGHQSIGRHRGGIGGHDLIDALAKQITAHMAAQIAMPFQ